MRGWKPARRPAPANAAPKDGILESGEMGFWSYQNMLGSVYDLYLNQDRFSLDRFRRGPQQGQSPNNNTLSYSNLDTMTWYVYTREYRGGTMGWIPAGHQGNASSNFQYSISSAYYTS
jgi:hypothetical protein